MLLGRNGDRVAKTPMRLLPPRRGGRTVGDQVSLCASEKSHISHICEKSSSPRNASLTLYSLLKTIRLRMCVMMPLCLGTPNLVSKSLYMCAIASIFC